MFEVSLTIITLLKYIVAKYGLKTLSGREFLFY